MSRLRRTLSVVRGRPRILVAFGAIAIVALVLGLAVLVPAASTPDQRPAITYSGTWTLADLERHLEAGEVTAIMSGKEPGSNATSATIIAVRTTDGQTIRVSLDETASDALVALRALGYGRLFSDQAIAGLPSTTSTSSGSGSVMGTILTIGFIVFGAVFLIMFVRRAGGPAAGRGTGGNFRTIKPRPVAGGSEGDGAAAVSRLAEDGSPTPGVAFADVAGLDEAKFELREVVDFLTDPARFTRLGARVPRGILLFGPPGNGKSLLGKAVATEAGVAFTYAAGSEFVEKFVGVGAGRVRELFRQARSAGRGVVFIDEIDAMGRSRGGPNNHQESETTLNQLLVEMDGFNSTDEIVVIAATNRLDTLDSALLRPGRFTRKIHIPQPDEEARLAILEVHARNKPLDEDVDLAAVARKSAEFSGAMLADLLNEAAIFAARRGADAISTADVDAGWFKVAVGAGRRRSMPPRERSIIAAHEAGHAICGRVLGTARTVEKISLYRHGEALGVTISSSTDNLLPAESDLRAQLVALMGGRGAEALLFEEVTGGASNDLDKANELAEAMVARWGMGHDPESTDAGVSGRGSLGFLVGTEQGALSSEAALAMTRARRAILDEAYERAVAVLVEHRDELSWVAAYLFEHEEIDRSEFDAVVTGSLRPSAAALESWRHPGARPRPWESVANGLAHRVGARSPERAASDALAPRDAARDRRDDRPRDAKRPPEGGRRPDSRPASRSPLRLPLPGFLASIGGRSMRRRIWAAARALATATDGDLPPNDRS